MSKCILLLLPVFLVIGFGQELIQNGDFEDSLRYWAVEVDSNQGNWAVNCSSGYHPDPDSEVCVHKHNRWYARIKQTAAIPSTDVDFSASAKLNAWHLAGSQNWAYSAIVLEYQNAVRLLRNGRRSGKEAKGL